VEWLRATAGGTVSALQIGGRHDLAAALLVALNQALFGLGGG
jgi:hypothetical protein